MTRKRTAFFISDRTGITVEMLGHSLLAQFDGLGFSEVTIPFVDTPEKAAAVVDSIHEAGVKDGLRPLVFCTLINPEVNQTLASANALTLDCFHTFLSPMEKELGIQPSTVAGRSHRMDDHLSYHHRIDAVNYALGHDDGVSTRDLNDADVILIGVSRCGKTPTCLYLALQYGIRAANYPLIPEDFSSMRLPPQLKPFRNKLYGLTIDPERLTQIRSERKPGSRYATLANCQFEVREAEALMRQEGIPYLDTTTKSIEELATTVLHETRLRRRIF